MSSGLDVLGARGAPIVWAPLPVTKDQVLQSERYPFAGAMEDLQQDHPEIHRRDITETDAAPILADVRANRRRAAGDVPRVMVVGDSSSRSVGYGLERWAADTGDAVVWSAGTGGCGLADDGEVVLAGRNQPLSERCRSVQSGFERQVAQFDPDVVIVLSTIYDLQQRRLDNWDDFRVPGDPGFDEYLVAEYAHVVDVLSARGARVMWLKNPCSRQTIGPWPMDDRGGPLSTPRIEHVNRAVLGEVEALRPAVRFFDLYDVLCRDGKIMNRVDGVDELREAGVHFTPEGSIWFAKTYAPRLLEQALR